MLELEATHTHLYPGARLRVVAGDPSDRTATVTFADGIRVPATLDGDHLSVPAHKTARGTAIPKKRWIVDITGDSVRIRARAGRVP